MFGLMQEYYRRRAARASLLQSEHERRMRMGQRQRSFAYLDLIGKTFKCGVHRWTIRPKHSTQDGRPMSPEIKVVYL